MAFDSAGRLLRSPMNFGLGIAEVLVHIGDSFAYRILASAFGATS
jgi:hypothetical protein